MLRHRVVRRAADRSLTALGGSENRGESGSPGRVRSPECDFRRHAIDASAPEAMVDEPAWIADRTPAESQSPTNR